MASTFAYTNDEGKRIITSASLLDEVDTETQGNQDYRDLLHDLKRLREKDIKLDLNSIQLSDYWRKGMIPRGLRIKKFPATGSKDNGDFRQKWEAILSKCSSDLMLLLIEEVKKDQDFIQKEMEELNKKIEDIKSEEIKKSLAKLDENMTRFKEQVKREKLSKLKRDEWDYKENKVYFWPKRRSPLNQEPQRRGARTVSFNFTSEEEDQGGHSSGYDPRDTYAGNGKAPRYGGKGKQKKEGRKKERGEDERNPYATRTRTLSQTR